MSNALTNLRTAIWSALTADATLTALLRGGTTIEWAGGVRKRALVEPARCPMLSMGPARADVPSIQPGGHDNRSEWRYRLRFEVYTAGQGCDDTEEIAHQVWSVLANEFPFGLASDGLYTIDIESVEFAVWPDEKAASTIWHCAWLAVARYRIG